MLIFGRLVHYICTIMHVNFNFRQGLVQAHPNRTNSVDTNDLHFLVKSDFSP